jgi:hypothetical protein
MTLSVLVPDQQGVAALARLDNVRPVRYDPAGPLPGEADEAEIIVVPPSQGLWPGVASRYGRLSVACVRCRP